MDYLEANAGNEMIAVSPTSELLLDSQVVSRVPSAPLLDEENSHSSFIEEESPKF